MFQSSQHLLVQSQQWKYQNNERKLFKVNKKRRLNDVIQVDLVYDCSLRTDFIHFSGVSVVDFQQVNVDCEHGSKNYVQLYFEFNMTPK